MIFTARHKKSTNLALYTFNKEMQNSYKSKCYQCTNKDQIIQTIPISGYCTNIHNFMYHIHDPLQFKKKKKP